MTSGGRRPALPMRLARDVPGLASALDFSVEKDAGSWLKDGRTFPVRRRLRARQDFPERALHSHPTQDPMHLRSFTFGLVHLSLVATLVFAEPVADPPDDPFAVERVEPIDRSEDLGSEEFLSDELLAAFDEGRMEVDAGEKIRLTVLRSFHAPLMFTWYPRPLGQESALVVKRLRVLRDDDGEVTYQGLDFNQRLVLRPAQGRLLKEALGRSPIYELPQADWMEPGLDGALWVFEVPDEEGSIVIARHSPLSPMVHIFEVQAERLVREMHLASFGLMLWTLSGVDELPY